MTYSELKTLVDYHYWARDRLLAAVDALSHEQFTRDLGSSFRSVRDTLVHLCQSEWVWHQRWNGTSPTAIPDLPEAMEDAAAVRRYWTAQERDVRAFVAKLGEAGIDRVIAYRNMAGHAGRATYAQMLQHLVNHGSYHRGQVTTMLRQLGAVPPQTLDLIAFYREQSAPLA
jgi:uncharacterized damage-inducible protein DinB